MTAEGGLGTPRTASEAEWLRVRQELRSHRHALSVSAASLYPHTPRIEGTPLLTRPEWLLEAPLGLEELALSRTDSRFDRTLWAPDLLTESCPSRSDGSRYDSYSEAVEALAAPAVFQNRSTYRLVDGHLNGRRPALSFGVGTYFDAIDFGESVAHEYMAFKLGRSAEMPLRKVVGDPCDASRRPVNVALSCLTLRYDRSRGTATFPLHWRDPSKVGHAGGLYHVMPVGIFQATSERTEDQDNDFDLWKCLLRESAEELLGAEEVGDERKGVNYASWEFAVQMDRARRLGKLRVSILGMGVDPLTWATDLLVTQVVEAEFYDEAFASLASSNAEGLLLGPNDDSPAEGFQLEAETIQTLTNDRPMQAAGAALLRLAWAHRSELLW